MNTGGVIGAVIAGGRSTRYGSPKALAMVGGERVIDRVVRAVRSATSDVILIANDAALASEIGLESRGDRVPDLGPLGGLDAALAWAAERGEDGIVAVGCDMPLLDGALLASLVARARSTGAQAVLPSSDGPRGVEPLVAYYAVSCLPAVEAAIARGDHRLIAFHGDIVVERISLDDVRAFGDPADLFMNMNSPADRVRAEAVLMRMPLAGQDAAVLGTRAPRTAEWLLIGDALDHILAAVPAMPSERVALAEAGGRVLSEPAIAGLTLPPWDNSGMDGYAVHAADVAAASRTAPVRLAVVGAVAAGEFPAHGVGRGEAISIMTGAPLPANADTVIRVEHTRVVGDGVVEIFDTMDVLKNIRYAGEDIRAGDTVLFAGAMLRMAEIGVLASIGVASPRVSVRPRVAILSTGDELVDLEDADEAMAGRRIINSNTYALMAGVLASGCVPVSLGIARDDAADLRARITNALDADVLITTAGASMGEHDLVKDALESVGMALGFWRVKMRPGSPFSFGIVERPGAAPLPVFGLPGNPVSAVVTFELLVRPALRRMMGRSSVHSRTVMVRAAERIESKPGMTHFLRATLTRGDDGILDATLTGPQGSGILTSVANADALLVVPLDVTEIPAGGHAAAVLLQAGDDAQATRGF